MKNRELAKRIKDATDLLALVRQTVKLRQQGSARVGLCPFHPEDLPSLHVVRERGFYHCFGCGKIGDALQWIQDRDGLGYPQAIEKLAHLTSIELPKIIEDGQTLPTLEGGKGEPAEVKPQTDPSVRVGLTQGDCRIHPPLGKAHCELSGRAGHLGVDFPGDPDGHWILAEPQGDEPTLRVPQLRKQTEPEPKKQMPGGHPGI